MIKKSKTTPVKNEQRSYLASVTLALRYHGNAEAAFQTGAMYAALCGLELQHLKREAGHGKWLEFCEKHFGDRLSERLAQKYMQVAAGLKIKARRNAEGEITFPPTQADTDAFLARHPRALASGRTMALTAHFAQRHNAETWALLQTPPVRLSDAQRARLAAAVESITDGETMASLVEAYRLAKQPAGSGAAGGYRPDEERVQVFLRAYYPEHVGTLYADLPEDVQAAFRKWIAAGDTDETQMALNFCAPVLSLFEDPDFTRAVQRIPITEAETMLARAEALVLQLRDRLRQETRRAA